MDEAKRKRDAVDHLVEMFKEGGGNWSIQVWDYDTVSRALATGSGMDDRIAEFLTNYLQNLDREPPPWCFLCDVPLRKGVGLRAMSVVSAAISNPRRAVVSGICGECFGGADFQERFGAACRRDFGMSGLGNSLEEARATAKRGG